MEQEKRKRKFVTLPMTVPDFEALNDLTVAIVARDGKPIDRTEVMREGINLLAAKVIGQEVFNAAK